MGKTEEAKEKKKSTKATKTKEEKKPTKTTKAKKEKKPTKVTVDKVVEVVSGNLIAGIIISMVTISLIILFVTLELSLAKVEALELALAEDFPIDNVTQGIFILAPHFFSFITSGFWSIIAALIIGAHIGGLVVRSSKKGILVGIISFGLLMFLQLAVGFLFDITAYQGWFAQVASVGGNLWMDFLASACLLMAAGAIGGILSRE